MQSTGPRAKRRKKEIPEKTLALLYSSNPPEWSPAYLLLRNDLAAMDAGGPPALALLVWMPRSPNRVRGRNWKTRWGAERQDRKREWRWMEHQLNVAKGVTRGPFYLAAPGAVQARCRIAFVRWMGKGEREMDYENFTGSCKGVLDLLKRDMGGKKRPKGLKPGTIVNPGLGIIWDDRGDLLTRLYRQERAPKGDPRGGTLEMLLWW